MTPALVIDTDPGVFSDDSAAIVMCLRGGLPVAGVTTVSGNCWAQEGTRNIRATLGVLGKRVAVHTGSIDPYAHTPAKARQQGPVEFFGAFATPRPRDEPNTAVDYLIGLLEKGPVDLLAIGPLTNIARVIERRPDLVGRVRRLVIMGGNVYVKGNATRAAEFNFWFDPEAASVVLRSAIREKVLFGLDVCNGVVVDRAVFDRIVRKRTPITKLYEASAGHEFPGFYKDPKATQYLWDELAAAYLIDPGVVRKSETRYLDVVTRFGPEYGKTVVVERGAAPVTVMLEADSRRALELYVRLMGARSR